MQLFLRQWDQKWDHSGSEGFLLAVIPRLLKPASYNIWVGMNVVIVTEQGTDSANPQLDSLYKLSCVKAASTFFFIVNVDN